ncbi:serine hydrolase [Candidatus Saccharibacteria bacterium]|nr:serine hydrolase [Candidatus Saccharibacteria bacterium]
MKNFKRMGALLMALLMVATLEACGSSESTLESKVWPPPTAQTKEAGEPESSGEMSEPGLGETNDSGLGLASELNSPNGAERPTQERTYLEILTPFQTIDKLVSEDVKNGFPGAQLCVMDGMGYILYSKAWGNALMYNEYGVPLPESERIPVTKQTMFDVGGTSEVFTAWYAALHLISTGELGFDTRIVDILGDDYVERMKDGLLDLESLDTEEIQKIEEMAEWKRSLTVEDLLRNRTGNAAGPDFHKSVIDGEPNPYFNESGTRKESLELIKRLPLMNKPRVEQMASDIDAVTLTFVVEKVTGKRLDQYLNELWDQIDEHPTIRGIDYATFNPMEQMYGPTDVAATEVSGNTRFGLVSFPRVRDDVVDGEVHDETAYYAMEGVSGNAGLFANAESLCRMLTMYLSPEYGMFSQEVLDEMLTPTELTQPEDKVNIGMPWYLEYDENGEICEYWMNGFTRCYAGVLPQYNLVMVYLTNAIHSPVAWTSEEFSEHDLAHARFAGTLYEASQQGMLFQPEVDTKIDTKD